MGRKNAYLVCGGNWHDFDYPRLRLLELLGEHEDVRTLVARDYRDIAGIEDSDFLVTYTCDLRPSEEEQQALHEFVASGKRWFALHGTNSVFEFEPGAVHTPRLLPTLMRTLGSQFIAHPPTGRYRVSVCDPEHPLVAGLGEWETGDGEELYLCEFHGEVTPLLETRFGGDAPGFDEAAWPGEEARPVMYLHRVGAGEVLYLTPGHRRREHDMQLPPGGRAYGSAAARFTMPSFPRFEAGSWEVPQYVELLRRGLRWARGEG